MQTITIHPSKLKGAITIAPSKSVMQRVCAAALLHKGTTIIHNPGKSNDDVVAVQIIQQLGATVLYKENTIEIISNGLNPISSSIDCGESGLSARMFASIVALFDKPIIIKGHGSLLKRPLAWFNDIFPLLDISINSTNNYLPLKIQGKLKPKNIVVDGSSSSQYLTGLLMAYSYAIQNNAEIKNGETFTITVINLNSKPYIDLTLDVMKTFGMLVPENLNYEKFIFHKTNQPINQSTNQPINIKIEGDWSGAAFFLVAAAIHGNNIVKGLQPNSYQADKKIMEVLQKACANFIYNNDDYIFSETKELNAFDFDATDCPDLFPPLVALASFCNGISTIKGVHRLANKESNRALSLQTEFKKFGVSIEFKDNIMFIHPPTEISGGIFHSQNDHRIAMAIAIVASKANGKVILENADAINKSYPSYYADLEKLGLIICE